MTNQNPLKKSSSRSTEATISKIIEVLFLRLGVIYGYLWSSCYKSEIQIEMAKKEWGDVLGKYDSSTIKNALILCRGQSKYPPTLPQFAEYCRSIEKRQETFYTKVDKPKRGISEVAEANLKKMYEFLNARSPR